MAVRLTFLRLKAGHGGERARVVHIGRADDSGRPEVAPEGVRVLCGLYLVPGTFDQLSGIVGAPCESCAINSPGPDSEPAIPEARRALLPS